VASISSKLARLIGIVALTLVIGLTVAGSARAGGGPGPGDEPPVHLDLGNFGLDKAGAIVFTGTLTCKEAADVYISTWMSQASGRAVVSAGGGAFVSCAAGDVLPVTIVAAPEQYRFHPGTIEMIGLEVDYMTATGYGNLFGFVDWDVRPLR
jgi:hypothetical protein